MTVNNQGPSNGVIKGGVTNLKEGKKINDEGKEKEEEEEKMNEDDNIKY